jgi:hypothetical protein
MLKRHNKAPICAVCNHEFKAVGEVGPHYRKAHPNHRSIWNNNSAPDIDFKDKPATPTDSTKPEGSKPDVTNAVKWNGHWYALVNDKDYTITEARAKAKALGGHLPYINSKEEEEFILSLAGEYRVAIGLILLKDGWRWGDGSKISYANWGDGGEQGKRHPHETLGESGDFVILRDKAWADINAGDQRRVRLILEWE